MSVENPFGGLPLPPVDRSAHYAKQASESIQQLHNVLGDRLPGKPIENRPNEPQLPIINLPNFSTRAQQK